MTDDDREVFIPLARVWIAPIGVGLPVGDGDFDRLMARGGKRIWWKPWRRYGTWTEIGSTEGWR
jgi:hypothetical protein